MQFIKKYFSMLCGEQSNSSNREGFQDVCETEKFPRRLLHYYVM